MEKKMNRETASQLVNQAIKREYAGIHTWAAADYLEKHGSVNDKFDVFQLRSVCQKKYRELQSKD